MEEFDLGATWNETKGEADQYYKSIESAVVSLARKNSKSVLQQLKKKIYTEFGLGIIVIFGFLYFIKDHDYFLLLTGVTIPLLYLSWMPYRSLLKKLSETPNKNIIQCLKNYIDILDGFIFRIKWISIIFITLGFFVGLFGDGDFFSDIINHQVSFRKGSTLVIISAVTLILLNIVVIKWYIPKVYGKHKKELEDILEHINDEE